MCKEQNTSNINDLVLIVEHKEFSLEPTAKFVCLEKSKQVLAKSLGNYTKNLCYEKPKIDYREKTTNKKLIKLQKESETRKTLSLISKIYKKCLGYSAVMVRKIKKSPDKLIKFSNITANTTWNDILKRSKKIFIWEEPRDQTGVVIKGK